MSKFLVIDSLARSGTTLLSSFIRSQEKSACFCPGFNESIDSVSDLKWPLGHANMSIRNKGELLVNIEKYKKNSIDSIKKFKQLYGFELEDFIKIINDGKTVNEIQNNIAELLDRELIAFRWNQGLFYFNNFVDQNKYWITIIRNPMDRACSAKKHSNWSWDNSLKASVKYAENINKVINNDKHKLIYYEDLIDDPTTVIKEIYKWLDIKIKSVETENLIGSNGEIFRPQSMGTINDKLHKKDGYFLTPEFEGVYKKRTNIYEKEMDSIYVTKYRETLRGFKIYEKYFI